MDKLFFGFSHCGGWCCCCCCLAGETTQRWIRQLLNVDLPKGIFISFETDVVFQKIKLVELKSNGNVKFKQETNY
jgi:hypothetical protein